MAFSITTKGGGLVELEIYTDRFHGQQLYLHIDQSANLNNGDGDCSIVLTNDEVKGIIAMLNDYITKTEGKTFVLLAEPLMHESVTITVDETKLPKLPPQTPTS